MDITGIINHNEFYSNHYLDAIFEADIKEVFAKWSMEEQESGKHAPNVLLRPLAKEYFVFRSRLERARLAEDRLQLQRGFMAQLLGVLGYEFNPRVKNLDSGLRLPVADEINRPDGSPELWILEALEPAKDTEDPLVLNPAPCLFPQEEASDSALTALNYDEIITGHVFALAEPPRWVILCSGTVMVLLDRGKWNSKRLLRFDLTEIFSRKQESIFKAMAALLHRDSVCPTEGLALLDTLDEKSHKHAFSVSEDLKYSLREAIELLGNEAVYYLKEKLKTGVFSGRLDAGALTRECLRYMYRLLFIFYIEARPELGYAPMNSEAYRSGYSLESLRDLEMVELTSEKDRDGYFLHHSIATLFKLIYEGTGQRLKQRVLEQKGESHFGMFEMFPLKTHLFDPERTPILKGVKFRNRVLLTIINLMSLTREKGKGNRRFKAEARGRISYARLGINQLGAVYEALLSYQGFFAETDLYEVKRAGDSYDELGNAYFVKAEDLDKYAEEERVYNDDGTLKMFSRGTFIYRLAGRDREKSASYYTPEVLTQCLVKYALKELLKDKKADDILTLKVCEPAMGSAAFLNEAVNQLAEAYLDRKQRETGKRIAHEDYARELQRVKMRLADNNVFGVDLNPVAVELAEVSLFLNTIHEGNFVPWFGMQLVNGNSLIGARRQVMWVKEVEEGEESVGGRKSRGGADFNNEIVSETDSATSSLFPNSQYPPPSPHHPITLSPSPSSLTRVLPGKSRPQGAVYHFLLPDRGMADYKDKVVKGLAKQEMETIRQWKKHFTAPLTPMETEKLLRLSACIDALWADHTARSAVMRERTTDPLPVWGEPGYDPKQTDKTGGDTRAKDRVFEQEMLSKEVRNSSPYRRLKLVMDYWCALWFWPIEKAKFLPSREEFYFHIGMILEKDIVDTEPPIKGQRLLFPETMRKAEAEALKDKFGVVDVDKMCSEIDQLRIADQLAQRYKFLHWELEYADIFHGNGGFDLILGNPPWLKVEWNEGGLMGDYEPLYVLRKFSAPKLAALREKTIETYNLKNRYLTAFEEADGTQNFLNAYHNYPDLKGIQTNLYKCFLPQSWLLGNSKGVTGFLHPEGVYDDPKGGLLRHKIYKRLLYHFQFQNEFTLFVGTNDHGRLRFGLHIYSEQDKDKVSFNSISNLFDPKTVDACFKHTGLGPVTGIKDDNNEWNTKGHRHRIINIDEGVLSLFSKLYDNPGTPSTQSRLPVLHSKELVDVLKKFASQPKKLGDLSGDYISMEMWHETNAQKDGTIRRETRFPYSTSDWILSGPHFYVGTPLNKTPRQICTANSHYDTLDLISLPDDYLPRTNYVPACSPTEYLLRAPNVPWDEQKPVTDFYRFVNREMIGPSAERTFIPVLLPKGVAHINTVLATVFKYISDMMDFYCLSISLPIDFRVKSTGMGHANTSLIAQLPILNNDIGPSRAYLHLRALGLTCLTIHYAELWQECWQDDFNRDVWAKTDPRLPNDFFKNLSPDWHRDCALRTDYARRQALVEIDVLTAMALGLTLEELKTIYRIQFPVLRQNENDTWYDQKGRIVFTCSKGLPGVGFDRSQWNGIKDKQSGTVQRTIIDDTLPGGPKERIITYFAPFDKCDREKDYETVWKEFERR